MSKMGGNKTNIHALCAQMANNTTAIVHTENHIQRFRVAFFTRSPKEVLLFVISIVLRF